MLISSTSWLPKAKVYCCTISPSPHYSFLYLSREGCFVIAPSLSPSPHYPSLAHFFHELDAREGCCSAVLFLLLLIISSISSTSWMPGRVVPFICRSPAARIQCQGRGAEAKLSCTFGRGEQCSHVQHADEDDSMQT